MSEVKNQNAGTVNGINDHSINSVEQAGPAVRLLVCRVVDLKPHPAYVKHHFDVAASDLSAVAKRGDLPVWNPIVITQNGTVLAGYAQFRLAQQRQMETIQCIQYELTESEAIECLIHMHQELKGLNDYCRILLALELGPSFRDKARMNQQVGGTIKGSSNLTEAQKIDVCSEVARVAAVCTGNVTKVKQLLKSAIPALLEALRIGEVSIHKAWLLSKLTTELQRDALMEHRSKKGLSKAINKLISRQMLKTDAHCNQPALKKWSDLNRLGLRLTSLELKNKDRIRVQVVDVPGTTIFLTKELLSLIEGDSK